MTDDDAPPASSSDAIRPPPKEIELADRPPPPPPLPPSPASADDWCTLDDSDEAVVGLLRWSSPPRDSIDWMDSSDLRMSECSRDIMLPSTLSGLWELGPLSFSPAYRKLPIMIRRYVLDSGQNSK
jgi:hypothetical protein